MSDLVLLLQVLFEVLHFLRQQSVHLHLLLYDALQLVDVGIDIIVHKPNPLNLGYQLALLS